jgi:hypothetical protein
MRRRTFPNFVGDVIEIEERQERMERVMQMLGVTPEYPYTFNINDGTRNRVRIGVVGADYGIEIVDNAGNSVLLANGTVVANAIKAGTLDCNLITVANLSATVITTGSLSATRISGGILDCNLMTVQNLNAGAITVGTFANPNDRFTVGSISGVKISDGTITGDKLLVNTIYADRIVTHSLTTDQIAYNGVNASVLVNNTVTGGIGGKIALATIIDANIGSLNAGKITAGQITVGGAGAISAIYLRRSSSSTPGEADTFIRWEGGTRIWSDTSNRMGINSIGSPMYIYVNSSERLILPDSGQITARGGVYADGNVNITGEMRCNKINLNQSAAENNIDYINILKGYNDLNFQLGNDSFWFSWYNSGWSEKMYLKSNGDWHVTGSKSADIKTSKGVISVFAPESPDVWLFDFCEDKEKLDPLFLEMTEGKPHFIKCEDGEYMVFRGRKGYGGKRFEVVDFKSHDRKAKEKKKLFENSPEKVKGVNIKKEKRQ